MTRRPPISPLFPYPTLSRSLDLGNILPSPACGGGQGWGNSRLPLTPQIRTRTEASPTSILPRKRGRKGSVTATEILKRRRLLRSEEHTSELQSQSKLVCRLL